MSKPKIKTKTDIGGAVVSGIRTGVRAVSKLGTTIIKSAESIISKVEFSDFSIGEAIGKKMKGR